MSIAGTLSLVVYPEAQWTFGIPDSSASTASTMKRGSCREVRLKKKKRMGTERAVLTPSGIGVAGGGGVAVRTHGPALNLDGRKWSSTRRGRPPLCSPNSFLRVDVRCASPYPFPLIPPQKLHSAHLILFCTTTFPSSQLRHGPPSLLCLPPARRAR